MRKLPEILLTEKTLTHNWHIAKDEEKEFLIIGGLSKENTWPITEISKNTDSTWCCIPNTKTHNTFQCRVHLLRSEPQVNATTVLITISQKLD